MAEVIVMKVRWSMIDMMFHDRNNVAVESGHRRRI